ncbi:enoyl-CoA hydratase/isomerase family protein [Georgenia sp. SYP-B2076]|uniref:enoyl-CoA hydratase/isomerase family protein n=1 Tax=Georgenia sp. SYP-B2076 TaxID=2495881 RepID=UPI000F8E3352|nr:enoyl-CoA hydratase/isomerase family protein [Georgenia sp. SYP-B2076]
MDGVVTSEIEDRIGVLTLERPHKLNALTLEMIEQLREESRRLDQDPEVRVIVVRGAGERAFSVGGDLVSLLPQVLDAGWDILNPDPSNRFFSGVYTPVVAAVRGLCLGGGLEIMLGTDVRIASDDATFGLPEVGVGLIPGSGSTVRLPRQIGWAPAMQLMLTGEPIDATTALRLGLVSEVVAPDDVLDRAMAVAARIAQNGPLATRTVKEAALRSLRLGDAYELEHRLNTRVIGSTDARVGVDSFRNGTPPEFTNG